PEEGYDEVSAAEAMAEARAKAFRRNDSSGKLSSARMSFREGRGFSPRCFSAKNSAVGACPREGVVGEERRRGSPSFRPEEAWGGGRARAEEWAGGGVAGGAQRGGKGGPRRAVDGTGGGYAGDEFQCAGGGDKRRGIAQRQAACRAVGDATFAGEGLRQVSK